MNEDLTMTLEPCSDEFEEFSAIASAFQRRGSMPLVNPETERVRNSPRRSKSLKTPRKKRDAPNVSPLVRHELDEVKVLEAKDGTGSYSSTLTVPSPCFGPPNPSPTPHSRSNSWRKNHRPSSSCTADEKVRTGSLTVEETIDLCIQANTDGDICPVRSFQISPRGLINRGDSFKYRSNASIASSVKSTQSCGSRGNSSAEQASVPEPRIRIDSVNSEVSEAVSEENICFTVLVLGRHGVGKTTLTRQFLTSHHVGSVDSTEDSENRRLVSVVLNREETILDVIEVPANEDINQCPSVDAFLVLYSITDRESFDVTADMLHHIGRHQCNNAAVVIVGNKTDLVRMREVSQEEGRDLATTYDCKYVEVSAALNLKVDELLVGLVHQICLNPDREEKRRSTSIRKSKHRKANPVQRLARGLLGKIFKNRIFSVRSCDNLMIL